MASIAFQRLEPARRLELADSIRNHPRFDEDFADGMPDDVKTGDEQKQAEWIFQQAACWPDRVRSLKGDERKKYHHASWHYVNKVLYLRPADEAVVGPIKLNLAIDPPAEQIEKMNAVQAVEFAKLRVSGEVETTPEDKAVLLCWLMHCYTDLHQPLHSTAMFSKSLLAKGCRGGNRISTKQGQNLHSLWDRLLGTSTKFRSCRNEAIEMLADERLKAIGITSLEDSTTVNVWNQSHELCKKIAYADEVRAHLIRLEDGGETEIAKLHLSEPYLRTAGRIAKEQAMRAGWRLGDLLRLPLDIPKSNER